MVESSRVGLALSVNLEINSVSLFVWFNCGLGGSIQTGKSLGDFAGVCVYYGFPAEHPLSVRATLSVGVKTASHWGTGPSLMEDLPLS